MFVCRVMGWVGVGVCGVVGWVGVSVIYIRVCVCVCTVSYIFTI